MWWILGALVAFVVLVLVVDQRRGGSGRHSPGAPATRISAGQDVSIEQERAFRAAASSWQVGPPPG